MKYNAAGLHEPPSAPEGPPKYGGPEPSCQAAIAAGMLDGWSLGLDPRPSAPYHVLRWSGTMGVPMIGPWPPCSAWLPPPLALFRRVGAKNRLDAGLAKTLASPGVVRRFQASGHDSLSPGGAISRRSRSGVS